jgi:hypothetical protein
VIQTGNNLSIPKGRTPDHAKPTSRAYTFAAESSSQTKKNKRKHSKSLNKPHSKYRALRSFLVRSLYCSPIFHFASNPPKPLLRHRPCDVSTPVLARSNLARSNLARSKPSQFAPGLPHIWVIIGGDAGIESGVVGYWYPDSEQLEWSYECERRGVCSEVLGPAWPTGQCAVGIYMRI